jgi:hypothetical protein
LAVTVTGAGSPGMPCTTLTRLVSATGCTCRRNDGVNATPVANTA